MANAASAISLSETPLPVKRPIEINATRQRCDYRRDVVYDHRLSPGARLLYVALDDYAGLKGEAWPQQQTLASRLGFSERWIRTQLGELQEAGYLHKRRGQRGVRYLLQWQIPTGSIPDSDRNHSSAPTGTPLPVGSARPIYEPDQEPGQQQQDAVCCDFFDLLADTAGVFSSL